MTNLDIARASGLSKSYVVKISALSKWDSLPLDTIEAFSIACGVDLLRTSDQVDFWRRRKKAYLENATTAQRKMFGRLMSELTQPT